MYESIIPNRVLPLNPESMKYPSPTKESNLPRVKPRTSGSRILLLFIAFFLVALLAAFGFYTGFSVQDIGEAIESGTQGALFLWMSMLLIVGGLASFVFLLKRDKVL